jgi:hypothetical protein
MGSTDFLSFFSMFRGIQMYYRGRPICKAAAFWGIVAGRINPTSELVYVGKPGWERGQLTNSKTYQRWIEDQNKKH